MSAVCVKLLLTLAQVFSCPFHDPVLTDRGFLNRPGRALRSFLLARRPQRVVHLPVRHRRDGGRQPAPAQPLLGDRVGPTIIAATTISGTMVMGLAPIFLLSWLRPPGALSFHLTFWPGFALGTVRAVETFSQVHILPASLALGTGAFALDLGVNAWGLAVGTAIYLAVALLASRSQAVAAF